MNYHIVFACGHGRTIYRKVFAPHVGDMLICSLCSGRRRQRVIAITDKRETSDGTTYNG